MKWRLSITGDVVYYFLSIFVHFDKIFDVIEIIKYLIMIFEDEQFQK